MNDLSTATFQNRCGLLPEHRADGLAPVVHERVRLTVPAREALERAGNIVAPTPGGYAPPEDYVVTLWRPPVGLVVGTTEHGGMRVALRLAEEPVYPGECPASWWERAAWLPCPVCGAALVWYEAGFVPGYRVCTGTNHHHVQVGG